MKKLFEAVFGVKVNNTRVFPVIVKIILIFTLFILVSNLATNYINLQLNRSLLIKQMKDLIVKDLKAAFTFCNNQYEIFQFNEDLNESMKAIEDKGIAEFKKGRKKSVLLGFQDDGKMVFQASYIPKTATFTDKKILDRLNDYKNARQIIEGFISFYFNDEEYFGYYRYNSKWKAYVLRAEEFNEFYKESAALFRNITIGIIIITLLCGVVGVFILRYILRFIRIITNEIMNMVNSQQLRIIDLKNAPNDDITYLGVAFNSLSSTIDNLVVIFKKFVNKDIANKAYREGFIRLEGSEKDLTILFTDIKSFTYITETLGSDIIKLLNLHYNEAINQIMEQDGIIGSIIGDALLAVFGALDEGHGNKSYQAITSAYKVQEVAEILRINMYKKKEEISRKKGGLNQIEKKIFKAVLLEVGVGIDGGNVFYGNIGAVDRMTNTVIGDNVNAASRLEGLTRVYRVPVICSEYVMNDVMNNMKGHGIHFLEIDTVQVKGKTTGKKVFWPIPDELMDEDMGKNIDNFKKGLDLYYKGNWNKAYQFFNKCSIPVAEEFKDRTKNHKKPSNWNGIWEMKTK